MKNFFLIILSLLCPWPLLAQTGYTCADAIPLTKPCSDSGQYSNTSPQQNGVTWFKYTTTYDFLRPTTGIYISVAGSGAGGTLVSPKIAMLVGCGGSPVSGKTSVEGNVSTFFINGLAQSSTYYIAVSGANTGTFKLCISNFYGGFNAGDCDSALYLCDKNRIYKHINLGTKGTTDITAISCLQDNNNTEDHKAWYKWKAATSGTLVFTLTAQSSLGGDFVFALYDLGTSGDCANAGSATLIRCMDNNFYGCPTRANYQNVGLDFKETDVTEVAGCMPGQNGELRYLDVQAGHIYALAVCDDAAYDKDYYTLSFTDRQGNYGTAEIVSPDVDINYTSTTPGCNSSAIYTVTSRTPNYFDDTWDFGDGATVIDADDKRNFTIKYSTRGIKTITVTASDDAGCISTASKTFTIEPPPVVAVPVISVNKPQFCIGDTILLSTPQVSGLTYTWSGPGLFTSTEDTVSVIATDSTQAGSYTLKAYQGACLGNTALVNIASFLNRPKAAFTTKPGLPASAAIGATVQFSNQSANADNYLWDFGDGSTSIVASPSHQYTQPGIYRITLTAYQSTACSNSVTEGKLTIGGSGNGAAFIPNAFTPNGDGINDDFAVTINNTTSFRIQIFDRYGQKLFETTDISNRWNGTSKGKKLPQGTYYYIIKTVDQGGKAVTLSGCVVLVR